MAEHGRYRGTVALDVAVPGAVPPLRLLALDARDRGFTLRGTTAPARTPDGTVGRAPMPFWVAEDDSGSRHETTSGGSGGHDDGSTTWSADLQPALAEGVRSVRLTEVLSPLRLESGRDDGGPRWPGRARPVGLAAAPPDRPGDRRARRAGGALAVSPATTPGCRARWVRADPTASCP